MVNLAGGLVSPQEVKQQLAHWDEDRGALVVSSVLTFFLIAFITVILRLTARWKQRLRLQWDDYLIIIALVLAIGLLAQTLLAVRFGAGIHSLKAGIPKMVKNLQVLFALQVTYNAAHLAIKTSILFLYKRIFTLNSRPFKYAWYTVLAYVVSCALMGIVVSINQCKPIRYSWEQPLGISGSCVDLKKAELGPGVATTVADGMILVMPMPMLWLLQITRVRKIQLCALFGIGFLAVAASIARIVSISRVTSSVDFTFDEVNTLVWSVLEVDLGIVCACVSNLRALFKRGDRQNGANSATSRSLLSSALAEISCLQWMRRKFGGLLGNMTDTWGFRRERDYHHSKKSSSLGEYSSSASIKMQSPSKVRIVNSPTQELWESKTNDDGNENSSTH